MANQIFRVLINALIHSIVFVIESSSMKRFISLLIFVTAVVRRQDRTLKETFATRCHSYIVQTDTKQSGFIMIYLFSIEFCLFILKIEGNQHLLLNVSVHVFDKT